MDGLNARNGSLLEKGFQSFVPECLYHGLLYRVTYQLSNSIYRLGFGEGVQGLSSASLPRNWRTFGDVLLMWRGAVWVLMRRLETSPSHAESDIALQRAAAAGIFKACVDEAFGIERILVLAPIVRNASPQASPQAIRLRTEIFP